MSTHNYEGQEFDEERTYMPTEYELARQKLAETRIAANLAVLDGTQAEELPISLDEIKRMEARVRELAESAQDIQLRLH
ncbi:MAG TPA: hypothetical protein VFP32_04180 [Candidatus Saccharimonadales bacterium]|nr:hypothetical protein [Candidatus Saccharimonadales bacterium]